MCKLSKSLITINFEVQSIMNSTVPTLYSFISNYIIFILFFFSISFSTTLVVPTDYPNIQAGIDASVSGDTVLVMDGIYSGEGNYEILINNEVDGQILITSLNGTSNTIIDCEFLGYGIKIHGNNHYVTLRGFSIINALHPGFGGIEIMFTNDLFPVIEKCIIRDNTATEYAGGGLVTFASNPIIKNCLIVDNISPQGSGILISNWSSPTIINSIILDNYYADGEWLPTFTSCNLSFEFYNDELNNINVDPLFINPETHNYYLQIESPCINAGDSSTVLDPDSTRVDIGPLYYHLNLKGDSNFDNTIDVLDIILSVNVILGNTEPYNAQFWAMDMNNDGLIDILDIVLLIEAILSQ